MKQIYFLVVVFVITSAKPQETVYHKFTVPDDVEKFIAENPPILRNGRIGGGADVSLPTEAPFVGDSTSYWYGKSMKCTSVIIKKDYILTARTCMTNGTDVANSILTYFGSNDRSETRRPVFSDWGTWLQGTDQNGDIALLRLMDALVLSNMMAVVQLPKQSIADNEDDFFTAFGTKPGRIYSWGDIASGIPATKLQQFNPLVVVIKEQCELVSDKKPYESCGAPSPYIVFDIFDGDIGAPFLYVDGTEPLTLIGLTSRSVINPTTSSTPVPKWVTFSRLAGNDLKFIATNANITLQP